MFLCSKALFWQKLKRAVPGSGLLVATLASIFALAAGCSGPNANPKYDVILISIDTLRADHLSCYGYFRKTSPTIDEFAKESVIYTNAFSQSAFTLSSHMSMLTSTFPPVHGLMNAKEFVPLSKNIKTLPEMLKGNGYETIGYYEVNNLAPKYGFDRGFDVYKWKDNEEVLESIENRKQNPFFLFVHYFDVHSSDWRDAEFVYDGPSEFRDRFGKSPLNHKPKQVYSGAAKLTQEELKQIIARYDGGILHVDHQLNELFKTLKNADRFDESLIILTSDHGESLGFKGMMNSHGWLYDAGTHVPLIVKLPKSYALPQRPRGEINRLVRIIDIMPTVLDVLSIEAPSYLNGESLFRDKEGSINYSRQGNGFSIRTEESKILKFTGDGRHPFMKKGNIEIYDLSTDPQESDNLYGKDGVSFEKLLQLAEQMEKEAIALNAELADDNPQTETLDAESIEDLKALGYLQ